jgi:hypothetical protein
LIIFLTVPLEIILRTSTQGLNFDAFTLAGAWAGGTEYGVNFVLLIKIVCLVSCVTSFPFVIFLADLKVFSYILCLIILICVELKFITHARIELVSPYRFLSTDGSVRNKSPGTLFFVFNHKTVPMYRTYVLCTRERRNILLIEM